jgi:Fur family transcriptional regulator, ferric uptake regulator
MKRRTEQRTTIERVFTKAGRPLGPREILEEARIELPILNLATVYRTLKRLVEEEAIVAVELPGEPARYELRQAAEQHHHHFRCTICGAVFDLEGCVEGLRELLPAGFQMTGHDILLTGHCTGCVG